MDSRRSRSAVVAFSLLLPCVAPLAHADSECTPRQPTPAETKSYADSYALFQRVAPKAPDGWTSTDQPPTGAVPRLCREYPNEPLRRHFERNFHLERGRQERDAQALQETTAAAQSQQATAASNQAKIAAIDTKINAFMQKSQAAAAAQRFGEVEAINAQMDALMQQKVALMGAAETDTQVTQIEGRQKKDTEATFALRFGTPGSEPRTGKPYRTTAGQGLVTDYDDDLGNPIHEVNVYFGGPQQAQAVVRGDPARVRALVDAADLPAIAAFR
jgi:hypothetical protein